MTLETCQPERILKLYIFWSELIFEANLIRIKLDPRKPPAEPPVATPSIVTLPSYAPGFFRGFEAPGLTVLQNEVCNERK